MQHKTHTTDFTVFHNISKIIERDSKSTTYKFALLRGVIDIIQHNSPYITFVGDRVEIPTGLLIEKWLIYYYPILESKTLIPQINGNKNLAFTVQFKQLIEDYKTRGGFSAFYNDLKNKGIPVELQENFFELINKIRERIILMPMKHIGNSINDKDYSVFKPNKKHHRNSDDISIKSIIENFGTFTIPIDYYEAFQVLGSFINGQDSILFKWAEFSVNASQKTLSVNNVLNEVLKSPITEREISASKSLYSEILQQEGKIHCVWTGKKISKYDIDHLIPFSVWKNNDLWNLLPSGSTINNQKRDKIPSPAIIEQQKDWILDYWEIIAKHQSKRFQTEIQVALLGNKPINSWRKQGISQLKANCNYLIEKRGFEKWEM